MGFYGGSSTEEASDIAVDIYNENIYVVGRTFSPNLPPSTVSGVFTSPKWFITSFTPQFGTFFFLVFIY